MRFSGFLILPLLVVLGGGSSLARAVPPPPEGASTRPPAADQPVEATTAEPRSEELLERPTWFDQAQEGLHGVVWRTARGVDSWMGPPLADEVYQQASGSVSAATIWDEFDGFDARVRFNVDVPLPRINERLHLFIGRYDPEEYVTERRETLGVIPPPGRDASELDETMAGLMYRRQRHDGSTWGGSVGGSFRSGNPDPYAKAYYEWLRPLSADTLVSVRETVFYRLSEGFGSTTRLDFQYVINPLWHLQWTTSGTISEESEGVRGFSNLTATRTLPGRRALVFRAGVHGETAAEVPLRDVGMKIAYRTSVVRSWFVLELCTSVTWPKHRLTQARTASLGFGVGCEVYFGNKAFSSRPVTF